MNKNMTSEQLFARAKELTPGGVHSPVRSFRGLPMTPRFFTHAQGAMIEDVEKKNYIDFCQSFGPLILGHTNSIVKEKIIKALDKGWSFGACEPYSLELAEFITERIPFIDQIRFVNSGTEAVMTALRLARGFTGKNKIIKFNGCYHGHVDSMLIKAGSGLAGTSEASSNGIPHGIAEDTIVFELDDLESVTQYFEKHHSDIAAIIIEPLPANNGLLPQKIEYLRGLKNLTQKFNSLLIFDEVISGFRMGFTGMAGLLQIEPDILTYGKVIGGGFPVGAIAAKTHIMQKLAPVGDVYQAGTLSANPIAMIAGLATLQQMTPSNYVELENLSIQFVDEFNKWLVKQPYNEQFHIVREGSLFWFAPGKKQIRKITEIPSTISSSFNPLFSDLLKKGIYIAPNAYEVGFVSLAHDKSILKELQNRLWNS